MTSPPFAGSSRFRPLGLVGRGAMGAVYRVHDAELGCTVALKTLEHVAPEQIYRLKREFRFVAGLTHPNLVQLHELVVTDDACFFTMEFVEGADFVAHVGGRRDDDVAAQERFFATAPQLVRGLEALHGASRLHRDVKPSNVLVTPDGRVVVLDFDLGISLAADRAADTAGDGMAGTPAYMAPEQAWGRPLTDAADWYATGVLMHEALTGQLPYQELPSHLIYSSGTRAAPLLGPAAAGLPERVRTLLAALLDPQPARRPQARDILACLSPPERDGASVATPSRAEVPLVGRATELAALRSVLSEPAPTTVVVLVDGPSGIGKTKLVQTVLADVEQERGTLVLRGQCRAQEAVPYKALDGIIDALSTFLVTRSDDELLALLPRHVGALAILFPVLARVPAIAGARSGTPAGDSAETRRRGFEALRELLHTIARMHRLVVWIDDLHWGDRDSAALLTRILEPPDAPALALVVSYRSDQRDGIALLDDVARLAVAASGPRVLAFHLDPLDPSEAAELAWAVAPPDARSPEQISAIQRDAGGSPFLIATMARNLAVGGDLVAGGGLRDVLAALVGDLPADARHLIELVAVAGVPIERSVVLHAHAAGESARPILAMLESRSLVRALERGGRVAIEAYHDRIREGVLARIAVPELPARNRALANALESSGRAEPDRLARHFHGAGDLGRAADYARAAADQASGTLAFERAAELYRQARTWDVRDDDRNRHLLRREADELVNAGRFVEGAERFLEATATAPPLEALDLRRRASEQLLAGGRIDDGVATLTSLLRDVGLSYPRSPRRAMLSVATQIVRILGTSERAPATAPVARPDARDLVRVDACYSGAKSLSDVDPMRGVYFSLQSLRHARAAGEPLRLGRSLSIVGGTIAGLGGALAARRGARMIATARAIADATGSIDLRGTIDVAEGQALMLAARWREAVACSDRGVTVLSEECAGYAFECNIGRTSALRALEELGELTTLGARARQLRDAAASAGNHYAEVAAALHLVLARLAADDPAGARALAQTSATLWTREGYHLQHLYGLRADAHSDLYEGREAAHAQARLDAAWPALRRSGLLRVPLARVDATSLRVRLALATARTTPAERTRLVRAAARGARRLVRERRLDADVHAALALAACAALRDAAGEAARHLDAAVVAAERADMRLVAAVARWRKGELLAGDDGARLVAEARAVLETAGVTAPERWVALYAPGFQVRSRDQPRQSPIVNGR